VPAIQWNSDLLPRSAIEVDDRDPLRLTVRVPSAVGGELGEITYEIQDVDGPVRGRILIRIPRPSSTDPRGEKSDASKVIPALPEQIRTSPSFPAASDAMAGATTGAPPLDSVAGSTATEASAPAGPAAKADSGPVLRGVFRVDVVRNGVCVPGLKAVLDPGRAMTVGKSSGSRGMPDLDLRGQFETPDLEAACSRQQAEVFWSEQRIWIKTLGKHPLKLLAADGSPGQDLPELHCWQPDQVLIVPGKLRLVLRVERS
jgi:hypothetical protein